MEVRIISQPISLSDLTRMAEAQFGNLIKATVDIKKQIMALGGDLHADEEQLLLEKGSAQQDLWGINLYPAKLATAQFIEFDSMINIRPSQGNMSRGVENPDTQKQIRAIVSQLVIKDKQK